MEEKFQIFLNGTHQQKATNFSLVKYLPPEIVNQIWLHYAYSLENSDIVELGLLSVLKKKFTDGLVKKDEFLLYSAIKVKNIEIIQWLIENDFIQLTPFNEEDIFNNNLSLLPSIIETRKVEIIEMFFRLCPMLFQESLEDPLILAASVNDLEIVKWIYNSNPDYQNISEFVLLDTTMVDTSIRNNNTQMLLWVLTTFPTVRCTKYGLVTAARTKNVIMFDLVYKTFFVEKKQLELAQYLPLNKTFYSKEIADYISTFHSPWFFKT